jgi:signal transduction histidine kinase
VQCYAGEINQVFMNIIANAIDAIEEAWSCVFREQSSTLSDISKNTLDKPINQQFDPVITITTELANSEFIRVHIADNGTGMTEAVKAKLFDPFFTTKPVGKGTGLGLSISYQIAVEHHKGNLCCVSDPGVGTEFTIELPICYSGSEPHDA